MAYLGMVVTAHFNLFFAHFIASRFRPIAFYFFCVCSILKMQLRIRFLFFLLK